MNDPVETVQAGMSRHTRDGGYSVALNHSQTVPARQRYTLKGRGRPGSVWAKLLALLILAITLGPRFRVGAIGDRSVDLRLQDLLLVPIIGLLLLSLTPLAKMKHAWGHWALFYASSAVISTVVFLIVEPSMPVVRVVFFAGRTLEILVVAAVVATLYRASGAQALRATLRAVHVAVICNVGWVAYQYVTGKRATLLGADVGDRIESYGPKLIGEPSAFGTGFFFALVAAVGAAEFVTRVRSRGWSLFLMSAGAVGTYLCQSRISMAAAALIIASAFIAPHLRRVSSAAVTFLILFTVLAVLFMPQNLQGRLSGIGIQQSLNYRFTRIWWPLLQHMLDNPVIGIGPGSLGTTRYPWTEAHNILLRTALDFGGVAAALFVGMLLTIMVRTYRARGAADIDVQLFGTLAFFTVLAVVVTGMLQESMTAVAPSHMTMLTVGLFAGAATRAEATSSPRCS